MKYRHILVPLDGSELAERAAATALLLGEAMSARVTLLTAVVPLSLNLDTNLYERVITIKENEARRYLQSAQYRFSKTAAAVSIDTVTGPAAKSIIKYAQDNEIDLIVMSSYGRSGISSWRFGNVAARVLRRATCAVAIIRAQVEVAPFAHKHILVPLDGSPLAEQALAPALAVAKAVGADLTLLHVTSPGFETVGPAITLRKAVHEAEARSQRDAEHYLQNVRLKLSHHQLPISTVVDSGDAADTIIAQADALQVDSIIMSRHGRSGPSSWFFGGVAENVLHGAHCATFVVKEHAQ